MFSACVAINEERVNSKRHFICCNKTKSKTVLEAERAPASRVFCCAGTPPESRSDVEGLPEKGIRKYFSKFVLLTPVKIIVLILFSGYLGVSIWGAINLKQGLNTKDLVADDSYYRKYQTWEDESFPSSAPVFFVIDKTYQYSSDDIQQKISELITDAQADAFISAESSLSWLQTYKSAATFYRNSSEADFIQGLGSFLQEPRYRRFTNDVVLNGDSITACRIYVFTEFIEDSQDKGKMMENMRDVASRSSLSVTAFSPSFVFYEQYVAILPQTLQTLGIGVAAVFLVTAIFMPHPLLLMFVVITMAMIMTGIIGFMYFWDLTLSSVTMIHLIMCVGFSVDFTAHICHSFMVADEDDRNERVAEAVTSSGGPIFNGTVSSVIGILMLSIAKSYIFKSFFQVMLLVILFGASHSLFFLPVVLSLIGPSKAKRSSLCITQQINPQSPNICVNFGMEMTNGDVKTRPGSCSSSGNGRMSSTASDIDEPFKIPRPKIA